MPAAGPASTSPARCAVVAGGTRRVGRWISEALLERGYEVHALYRRDTASAARFAAESHKLGRPLSVHALDCTDGAAVANWVHATFPEPAAVEVLVAAMGAVDTGALTEAPELSLIELWRSNVLTVHNLVTALTPRLLQPGGRIVTFAIPGADSARAFRDIPLYGACKAALVSYTRSLARELAPRGITANCIALGITTLPPEGVPGLPASAVPAGRLVEPADLAACIGYLISPDAGQLTGSVLNLSGGFGL